jgi:hypothetical protein
VHHLSISVVSHSTPPISWHCRTCGRLQPFDCTERFRANSNGKLVDVWLIYGCRQCDTTKNITVAERTPVRRLPEGLLARAIANDALTARRLARDKQLLRRNGVQAACADAWELLPAPLPALERDDVTTIALEFPEPLLVRLDAVLARVVAVPRKTVRALIDTGALDLDGVKTRPDALRLWAGALVTVRSSQAYREFTVPRRASH